MSSMDRMFRKALNKIPAVTEKQSTAKGVEGLYIAKEEEDEGRERKAENLFAKHADEIEKKLSGQIEELRQGGGQVKNEQWPGNLSLDLREFPDISNFLAGFPSRENEDDKDIDIDKVISSAFAMIDKERGGKFGMPDFHDGKLTWDATKFFSRREASEILKKRGGQMYFPS